MSVEGPDYTVLELQAENEKLKMELIDALKVRIQDLEREVEYLKGLITWKQDEKDVGSHAIAPPFRFELKPRLRTMTEVAHLLEKRSINAAEAKLSAEDLPNDKKVS